MATTSDSQENKSRYIFEYQSSITQQFHGSRTASRNAAFLLPHLRPDMSLLDCGCGAGSITVGLAERVAPGEVVGVDISESQIEKAREIAANDNILNLRFDVASIYDLPFPSNSFDSVFSHAVLEHLDDPIQALKEMRRVLNQVVLSASGMLILAAHWCSALVRNGYGMVFA
jgi:ubiquinone/menaquinone biosynthesis C-methylase UbiE